MGYESGTATILFTDVVGSTELRSRLGAERADALRRAHDDALTEAVTEHGGTVVKGLGDGLMVSFGGATDAVAAAVQGQQRIAALARRPGDGTELVVRMGLSAGDVTWEDGDCHGTPVVTAARLCDSAEGGQVLVDDLVRGLARSRTEHELRLVGERELKGLDEAVLTFEVGWSADPARGTAPLPGPLVAVPGEFPFAGRSSEREALAQSWKAASAGHRRVMLVSGEPGQGKTRLTAEAARAAHEEGAWALVGRCDEQVNAPYAPWLEIVRHAVAHADDDLLAHHAERTHGDLARLSPDLGTRVSALPERRDLDPETERLAVYDAVTDLLAAIAEQAPAFVIVEDAHWADEASIALLRRAVGTLPTDTALLVAVTYRDTDLDRSSPLSGALGDLRREAGVERVALRGMDADDVARLLTAAGGQDLDDEGRAFAASLARETEGNPFFVGEVLRHLADTGVLVQQEGRWQGTVAVGEAGLPEGVREVVGQRLSRLSRGANETLRVAAVVGREFGVDLVAAITDRDLDVVLDHVEEALPARLLDEVTDRPGRMTFSHALVRATLLDELSTTRRVRLHARVAEELDRRGGATPAELAHHFSEAATAGLAERAVEHCVAAAEDARSRAAFAEEARFYQRAIEAHAGAEDDADRIDLHLSRIRALDHGGDMEAQHREAAELADMARRWGKPDVLVLAGVRHLGDFSQWADPGDPTAIHMVQEGLEGATDPAVRAQGLAAMAMAAIFDPEADARSLADEAERLARQVADPVILLEVLTVWLWSRRRIGPIAGKVDKAEEALRLAEQFGTELHLGTAVYQAALVWLERGEVDRAAEQVDRLESVASGVPDWNRHNFTAAAAAAAGRWEEAIALTEAAHERGAVMGQTADSIRSGKRMWLALVQGRLEEAERWGQAQFETWGLHFNHAHLALVSGDLSAATRYAHVVVEEAPDAPPILISYAPSVLARIAMRAGDGELAAWVRPWVETRSDAFDMSEVSTVGAVARFLGLVEAVEGDLDGAVTHVAQAVAAEAARPWPVLEVQSRVDLARILFRRGDGDDHDRAAAMAREAAEQADAMGMPLVAAEASTISTDGDDL